MITSTLMDRSKEIIIRRIAKVTSWVVMLQVVQDLLSSHQYKRQYTYIGQNVQD